LINFPSQAALTRITALANIAQNQQVLSFASQGNQGLDSAGAAIARIGEALITGATASVQE